MLSRPLRDSQLFSDARASKVERMLANCEVRHLAAGDVLVEEGQKNQNVFMVTSGALTLHLNDVNSPVIHKVFPGETVGELSLISSAASTAFVVAEDETDIVEIHQDNIWALMHEEPVVARNVLQIMSGWVSQSNCHIAESQRQLAEMAALEKVDETTGILNRNGFDEEIAKLFHHSLRHGEPLALLLVDIDEFASYRQAYGMKDGNAVLKMIASVISDSIRAEDFAYRMGDYSFAVVLPRTSIVQIEEVAERIRLACADKDAFLSDGLRLPSITLSMGVATVGSGVTSAGALVHRANEKLLESKQRGGNCCSF